MFKNIAVGISGGVDSAVAAYLLKSKGYNVLGIFMKNWDDYDEIGNCLGEQDLLDAEYTCNALGIELKRINYVKEYWNSVFVNFLDDYQSGLTPNPDILCNKYIKFDLFHKYVFNNLKFDAVATGHYAKTSFGSYLEHYKEKDDVRLHIPRDTFKDQTIFLAAVSKDSLKRTMFPLGNYLKTEVKDLAKYLGLRRLLQKKESTGICFIGHRKFQHFIKEYILPKPGKFVDIDTQKIVGQHQGVHLWTVGQRCRLHSHPQAYYVANKDITTNTIYVALGHNHPTLFSDKIFAKPINWFNQYHVPQYNKALKCLFRFQHTKPLIKCTIIKISNNNEKNYNEQLLVLFEETVRAVTPGQYAVFYNNSECLGCARILSNVY